MKFTRPPSPPTRGTDPPAAACAGFEDDNLWFPPPQAENYAAKHARAAFCDTCPIAAACLTEALTQAVEGVWAGTTWAQRQRMRRARGIKARSLAYTAGGAA